MRALASLLLVAVLVGCGGSDSTAPKTVAVSVTGNWSGPVQQPTSSGTLTLSLQQSGQSVTGQGNFAGAGAVALTAAGTFIGNTLSLTISSPGTSPSNLSGTVNANVFTGTLNGSGFVNAIVNLTKQ